MASSSMEIPAIHGWNMPSVVETRNEMYGLVLWNFLPSIEIPAIHVWNMPSVAENREEMYGMALWKSIPSLDGRPTSMDRGFHRWHATYAATLSP